MQPSKEKIEQLKAQFPDRELRLVEAVDGDDEVIAFVMTSPLREEHRFYTGKAIAAQEIKDETDRLWATRQAVENAALAQIRWPEREACKAAFDRRPEMIDAFAVELRKAAGSGVELRSKKL